MKHFTFLLGFSFGLDQIIISDRYFLLDFFSNGDFRFTMGQALVQGGCAGFLFEASGGIRKN
jgi:hypothetical protein